MDAAFLLLVYEGSEIRTNQSLLYYSSNLITKLVSSWCSLCFSRDLTTGDGWYAESPVADITGPWNCVVYRDIRLLKAHSCSHRFSSNCMGDAAREHSSGCGFV